jgi:hypothetical protein
MRGWNSFAAGAEAISAEYRGWSFAKLPTTRAFYAELNRPLRKFHARCRLSHRNLL